MSEPAEAPAEPDTTAETTADPAGGTSDASGDAPPARTSWWRRGPVLLVAGTLLTAAAIAAAVVVIDREQDAPASGTASSSAPATGGAGAPAAAEAFVAGATAGITAVTAYDYRSLDVALQAGLEVTTGSYRTAYRAALTGDLAQRARQDRIVQTFTQSAAGIGTLSSDLRTAKVLIFGVQSVRRGDADPVRTPISLTATMQRQGDRYLIAKLESGSNAGVPSGSPQLAAAAEAARRQVIASLTLRRDSLAADYAAALVNTANPLRAELPRSLQSARKAVGDGDGDLSGRVTAVAIEQAGGNRVVVLVAATGYREIDRETVAVRDERLRVTANYTGGRWRISDSQPVDS